MNAKRTIQKILFILLWIVIGAGMLTLLVAAISKRNRETCKDYLISIDGQKSSFFFDEKDVLKLIADAGIGNIRGEFISNINLRRLESLLEDNICVKDAQLYIDNRDVLHVIIKERKPVARIFTKEDDTYYIDDQATRMPLSQKMSADVPVFTGFPVGKMMNESDSLLLDQIKSTAIYILNDSFWMAQVAQIDITEQRTFEMLPMLGNHTVLLGDGSNIDKKFHRLLVFYKEILSKAGLDKYPELDLRFDGQLVATKRGTAKVRVDTSLLRLNVQRLLQKAKQTTEDPTEEKNMINEKPKINADTLIAVPNEQKTKQSNKKLSEDIKPETNPSPQPVKNSSEPRPSEKLIPKAVMQKKNDNR